MIRTAPEDDGTLSNLTRTPTEHRLCALIDRRAGPEIMSVLRSTVCVLRRS